MLYLKNPYFWLVQLWGEGQDPTLTLPLSCPNDGVHLNLNDRTPRIRGIDSVKRNSLRRTATVCDYDLRHFLFGAFIPDHSAPRPFDSQ